ncbi:TonB-dependent receptor [Sphingobium sufflavum]|uniref:TonB-dependent receptor n=1 Tax=Sphingobium sufflavum TaxID=1129547 RepID=UPI001F1F6887|nr:TonB-dependent receptor [Sphingobium sufflavum]MCE7796002.1 TonB-dependent receptor [Sphingobium sufflavum]
MKTLQSGNFLKGVSFAALILSGASVQAQTASDNSTVANAEADIIVQARRKDETSQDVPLVVNAVTSESIAKLNIRKFEDITSVVPGLTLSSNADGIGTSSSMRGVNYDVKSSGNNGTIEFYMNDAPISSGFLFQNMYDVGQIEVLRGPQGTLRGRASPSGSITITSRRPNLHEIGGYAQGTATTLQGGNVNGAFNLPVIKDVFAIRVAGILEENEGNRVRSVNNPTTKPYSRTGGLRVSALLQATDNLSFSATYQHMISRSRQFDQVESTGVITAPLGTTTPITAADRRAVAETPTAIRQLFNIYNWAGEYHFAGQKLNYVGSKSDQTLRVSNMLDGGDFFGPAFGTTAAPSTTGSNTYTEAHQESHELRLSSETPLFGVLDYVGGAFVNRLESPSDLTRQTLVFFGLPSPTTGSTAVTTPISRRGRSIERSLFGNVTLHLGDAAEISGGVRYINYKAIGSLVVSGATVAAANENDNFNAWIYSANAKYRFSDNLMVYASFGSSWRPGINVVGDFNPTRTALEQSFIRLAPEESKSYEIGVKSNWLNKRVTFNVSAFHQDFENYPYRVGGSGVFYVNTSRGAAFADVFNFVGAVPVKVDGVEVETSFRVTPHWSINASGSYALGKVQNGLIPCNDANVDGIPDANATVPTVTNGRLPNGDVVAGCRVSYRSSFAPLVSATVSSEYSVPLSDKADGYLRGLLNLYGNSQNDPANSIDDVKNYALLNLYAGVRDPSGAWELSFYGKNITETKRVLSRNASANTTGYNIGATGVTGTSNYRGITYTAPREFGVSLRYAFGSR